MKKLLFLILLLPCSLNAVENIKINNYSLSPEFNKNSHIYNVYTNKDREIITIIAEAEEGEIVTGTGSKSLQLGLNTFIVSGKEDYIVNVFRGEDINDSSALLKYLNVDGFDKNTFIYYVNSIDEVNYITESPTAKTKLYYDDNAVKIDVINSKVINTYTIYFNNEIESDISNKSDSIDLLQIKIDIIVFISILMISLTYVLFKKSSNSFYIKRSILHK